MCVLKVERKYTQVGIKHMKIGDEECFRGEVVTGERADECRNDGPQSLLGDFLPVSAAGQCAKYTHAGTTHRRNGQKKTGVRFSEPVFFTLESLFL